MKRMLCGFLGLIALGLASGARVDLQRGELLVPAAAEAADEKVSVLMRGKLENAKQILEGLALQDFEKIGRNAQQLSLLSRDAGWQVVQTPEYLQLSAEFRQSAEDIMKSSRQKNLDGATLAYVGLTLKCVQCHKYVRSVQDGDK